MHVHVSYPDPTLQLQVDYNTTTRKYFRESGDIIPPQLCNVGSGLMCMYTIVCELEIIAIVAEQSGRSRN